MAGGGSRGRWSLGADLQGDGQRRQRLGLTVERRAECDANGAREGLALRSVPRIPETPALVHILEGERRDRRIMKDDLRLGERVPIRQRALPDHEPGTLRALVERDDDRGEGDRGGEGYRRRLRDELEALIGSEEQEHRGRRLAA